MISILNGMLGISGKREKTAKRADGGRDNRHRKGWRRTRAQKRGDRARIKYK